MKRPTTEERARHIKASLRELWKRRRRPWKREVYREVIRQQNAAFPEHKRLPFSVVEEELALGGPQVLLSAPETTLKNFRVFRGIRPYAHGLNVRVKLDEVTDFDAAGLLLLCSRVRNISGLPSVRVHGTFPKHAIARQKLVDAHWMRFLFNDERIPSTGNEVCLQLLWGNERRLQPEHAAQIRRFLAARNPSLTHEENDTVHLAVSECLENVRGHAYSKADANSIWYAVGLYDRDTNTTSVAILDTGRGIAQTVRPQLVNGRPVDEEPEDILEQATQGLRTASGAPGRGKGLRSLSDFARAAPGRFLHVLSSDSMITWSATGPQTRRLPPFEGTIVCLQMIGGSGAATTPAGST